MAQSTSSRSAVLTWDPPNAEDQNGVIVEYTINVTAVETGEEFQFTSNTTIFTVTTLRPFTTYLCTIAASTSIGLGPFSTVFTLRTPEDGESSFTLMYVSIMPSIHFQRFLSSYQCTSSSKWSSN